MSDAADKSRNLSDLPPISVILALRNEERYLEECLQSLTAQDYPQELVEILLIDGMSTDRTPEIIDSWVARDSRIRAFSNPGEIVSTGMNLGIRESRFDLILWTSGHVRLQPDHLKRCVETMRETAAAAVGGILKTVGESPIGRANAAILSSPFGVGGGAHRIGGESGWVTAVTMALYSKQAIIDAGGFNESLVRSQDNDLHGRMNRLGLKSFLNPEIRPTYLCRDSIGGLLKQAWHNGYWNISVAKRGGGGLSPRHFVPMTFVFVLLLLTILTFVSPTARYLLVGLALVYGLCSVIASVAAAIKHKLVWQLPCLPLGFLSLHLTYGAASWQAFFAATVKQPNSADSEQQE
ncbi:MAG: glycosyltransferase family 2 protein [bacterium]